MKKAISILVILVILAGLSVISQKEKGEFVIGVMVPVTGIVPDYGEEIKRGILAADTEGITFIFEDTQCEAMPALDAYRKLVDLEKVQFIVGPGCGAPQEIIAPLIADDDVVVSVPSAAARSLYEASNRKMFFTQYSLEDEATFIANTMYERGYHNVALISFQNAFSETHARTFKEQFKGNIVAELSFLNGTLDVGSELLKLRNQDIDAIFSTDVSFLFGRGADRIKEYGIDVPFFSQYAIELPAVRDLVVDGTYYSFPDNVGDEGAVFELSKKAAQYMIDAVKECAGEYECVVNTFRESGDYDEYGVREQSIILKQIVGGKTQIVN